MIQSFLEKITSNGSKKGKQLIQFNRKCSFCTYVNPPNVNECEICNSKRRNTNLDQTSLFSVFSLKVDDLVDCSDFRGEIYPSKVVAKNKNKITIRFGSCKLEYGIGKYTLKDECIENYVNKIKNLEDPKSCFDIYFRQRSIFSV